MSISSNKRFKIFTRDNFTCQYCNRSSILHGVVLTIDHIDPKSVKDDNSIENLITCCSECNAGKSHDILDEGIKKVLVFRAENISSPPLTKNQKKNATLRTNFEKVCLSNKTLKNREKNLEKKG